MKKYKYLMAVTLVFMVGTTMVSGITFLQREHQNAPLPVMSIQTEAEQIVIPYVENEISDSNHQRSLVPPIPFDEFSENISESYSRINLNEAFPTFASRYLDIESRRPGYFNNHEQLLSALSLESMWEPTNQLDSAQDLLDKLKIKDPELLRFSPQKLESLVVGDFVDIPIKQTGKTYQMRVDSVRSESGGDVIWRGYIHDNEQQYYVSFTRNEAGLTIGGVNTPQGHFTLEAHEDVGWISASQSSFQYSATTDVVYPHNVELSQDD